jgi:PAS domain S-box-containing protein/diguanylate cyclase (GGDEF)-like protein
MLDETQVLRSALETVPVGLYVVDRERKIVLWSDGAEHITGYLRQEVIGHFCRENILDHCDSTGVRVCETACPLTCAIQNGRAIDRVLYLKHKQGHRVPVRVFATGVRNAHGHVIGAMEVFHEQATLTKPIAAPGATSDAQAVARPVAVIPNRPLTLASLREAIGAAKAQMIGCGVVCIQVAHFFDFKTAHTLGAGNQMMDAVSGSVRQMLRQSDQVGRWSEDQLLVILPGCHASSLETVATRLATVSHQSRIRWWGDDLSVKVWIGGVMAHPDEEAEVVAARAVAATEQCSHHSSDEDVVLIES